MSKKILVAEDDKFIAHAYKSALADAKYETMVAGDGRETLKLAQKFKPDLILLDLVMPIKNGFETLKDLRKDQATKDIPVIVLSNLGQESDIEQCEKYGIADYLVKSNVSMKDVIKCIKKALK